MVFCVVELTPRDDFPSVRTGDHW